MIETEYKKNYREVQDALLLIVHGLSRYLEEEKPKRETLELALYVLLKTYKKVYDVMELNIQEQSRIVDENDELFRETYERRILNLNVIGRFFE